MALNSLSVLMCR